MTEPDSLRKPVAATPSPRKPELPVSESEAADGVDDASPKATTPEPRAQPHTPKRVTISESSKVEHPPIFKPRPDTPMPVLHTRETPSVAHLRTSFEHLDDSSPRSVASSKPDPEPIPSPLKESMIHRRDWAVRTRRSSRGQPTTEKLDLGRLDQQTTPSPLQVHPRGCGTGRAVGPQLTDPSSSTYSQIPSTGKVSEPRISHRKSSVGQASRGASGSGVKAPGVSGGRGCGIHQSPVHPLLRQSQSVGTEGHGTTMPQNRNHAEGPVRAHNPRDGFCPALNHPLKVADLRERYDRASSSTAFLPSHRKMSHNRRRRTSPTASLAALSAAIGLATFPGSSKTPSPTEAPPSHSNNAPPATTSPPSPPEPQPQKTPNRSPLRDKITIFESLSGPATTLAKTATSSRAAATAAATVRRRSGDVTSNLKRIASNGTHIWRRLSGSFDKELDRALPSSGGDGPPTPQLRPRGFEPSRGARPTAARESTLFVQGTISRVPAGFATRRQREEQKRRAARTGRSEAPSLPDLDFEVDGAAGDMVGYFEQEFDICFEITGARERRVVRNSGGRSAENAVSVVVPPAGAKVSQQQLRNPPAEVCAPPKSGRASPVLSVRSVRASRPEIPPRDPRRTRGRRPLTPAPARNRDGGFRDNRPLPVPRMMSVAEESEDGGRRGDAVMEEEMVVSRAQCGLAHPRPSRVLDVRRFVGYCRETARARGKL